MLKSHSLASLIAGAALLVQGCASTDYGVRTAGEKPTDLSSTEASMWFQMDKAEEQLKMSGAVVEDASLNEMVRGIFCDVSAEFCDELSVYIVDNAMFNAFMAPNGMSVVYTGLLLRVEDTSQLAAVLAHEFVHYEENHSLEMYGAAKNANVYGTLVGGAIAAAGGGGLATLGQVMVLGGAYAFSRDNETEADLKGIEYMHRAGYNAGSASLIWLNLQAELQASDSKDKRKRADSDSLFASHPMIDDRITALQARAAAYETHETDSYEYRAVIRPFLKSWLDAELVKKDFGASTHLIERLMTLGEDKGVLLYARGRAHALRGEEGDEAVAFSLFTEASGHTDAPVDTFRAIAEIHRTRGDTMAAAQAFEAYLEKDPSVRDAALVRKLISDLRGDI